MSEVRQELVLWQAYCEKKMALEDAQDEIEKLRAALRGLLEWAGPIAGDTQIISERAFEEETVAAARAALGEKE
jgi:hypothetical protein